MKEFLNRQTANFTLILYALSPAINYVSVVTLSESYYIFFTISLLYAFFTYLRSQRTMPIIFMALFIAAGMLTRYEAWISGPLCLMGLVWLGKKHKILGTNHSVLGNIVHC